MSSLVLDFSLLDLDVVAATFPVADIAALSGTLLPLEVALRNPLFGLLHSTVKGVVQGGVSDALRLLTQRSHVNVHALFLHACIITQGSGDVKPFFEVFPILLVAGRVLFGVIPSREPCFKGTFEEFEELRVVLVHACIITQGSEDVKG